MKQHQVIFLAILIVLVNGAREVAAFDLPEWADDPAATCQQWSFSTGTTPAAPEAGQNGYGSPTAAVQVGALGEGWFDLQPLFGSCQGFWDLGSAGAITLTVPNSPIPHQYEEVWVEVKYFRDIWVAPAVDVLGAQPLGEPVDPVLVEQAQPFGGWYAVLTKWRVAPSEDFGSIVVTADVDRGSIVDEITVRTISVDVLETIPGDANRDCRVNIVDMIFIRNRFGQDVASGDNALADVNGDGRINVLDLIFVRNHLSETCGE